MTLFQDEILTSSAFPWQQVGLIVLFYFLAYIISRLARRVAGRLMRISFLAPKERQRSQRRRETLRGLLAGALTFMVFSTATLFSLSLFVDAATLVWMVGLFSAAFGLGARPLVSDFLAGLSFIFEDTFEVGEKIQLPGLPGGIIEGVVEAVNLRTTRVRSMTGEPYVVPNGEIRVVRNFSRGRFSTANVHLTIEAVHLQQVLTLLEEMSHEAVGLLPNLLEPWLVISESGEMGAQTTLTLVAKARFGNAVEMRPRLLALVQERLAEAEIPLVG